MIHAGKSAIIGKDKAEFLAVFPKDSSQSRMLRGGQLILGWFSGMNVCYRLVVSLGKLFPMITPQNQLSISSVLVLTESQSISIVKCHELKLNFSVGDS